MKAKMKKLTIMLLVGCLLFVAISNVCADDNVKVDTFKDMNGNITAGKNVTLKDNIVGLDGISNGIEINRNTTVDGNGHYIDAQQQGIFFNITNGNAVLTLINITLKNSNGNAIDSSYNINIIANDNVCFNNNTAKNGAAIFSEGMVKINSTNGAVTFKNNTGDEAGAIYAKYNVTIDSYGNVCFNNNVANNGGAIRSEGGMVKINSTKGSVIFENNKATETNVVGGSICAYRGVVITSFGNVRFNNNTARNGGAIASNNMVKINSTKGSVIFENNKANSTDGKGGAIGAGNNVTIVSFGDVCFNNNNATGSGGAIYSGGMVNITSNNGAVTFENNKATTNDGGAIRALGEVTIKAAEDIIFTDNFANSTGANDQGGAGISAFKHLTGNEYEYYNVTLTSENGNIIFRNNSAGKNGGAILGKYINITSNNGNVTFENNKVKDDKSAGAIYAKYNVTIDSYGNVCFINNTGGVNGGAIDCFYMVNITSRKGNVTFENNKANSGVGIGGAICAGNVTIDSYGNVCFKNNTAGNQGGAIYTDGMVNITSRNGTVTFENNKGKGRGDGGAIRAITNVIIDSYGNVYFINNTIKGRGGAIYSKNGMVNITNAVFYGNNASNCKIIYVGDWANSNLTLNFWGVNYKNKTQIIEFKLIGYNNNGQYVYYAPDNWILLNLTTPTKIVTGENTTFQSKFNILTNGTHNSTYNNFNGTMLVKLNSTLSNSISYVMVGKPFNMTFDKEGYYKLDIINIFNNQTIIETSFKVDANIRTFKDLQELIDNNSELVLKDNYTFINSKDTGSLIINKKILIDGNGTTINGNSIVIFRITKNGNLTLKNINLINTKVCIVNDGVLNVNNVKSTGSIINNGVITSGVKFMVINSKVTTYDSFLVSLRTDNGIPIAVNSLKFTDDQGHNYESYIYYNGYYVNYVPEGIVGHVTFNNSTVNNFNNLTTKGSLDITKYPKTSNNIVSNIVKSVSDKIIKNTVIKTTPTSIINNHIVKNINSILKNTVDDIKTNIFKFLRA